MKKELFLERVSHIDGRTIYFEKYRDGKLIETVKIHTLVKEYNDFKYIILLNKYGTIFEAYKYLNDEIGAAKWKKREKAMQSLKLLFLFVELFNIKDYKRLSPQEFAKFKAFLSSGIQKGNILELNCKTVRQLTTLNQYFSVYRDFYSYLGINDSVFSETKPSSPLFKTSATSSGYYTHTLKYSVNEAQPLAKRIPKYIRLDEYSNILILLESGSNNYGLREEIIIRLMFEYGLRLSEVLGLTVEDIKPLNNNYGKIILRNRVSDKEYNHCKNLIIPKTTSIYKSADYNLEKVGFHSVIVSEEIINLIEEYIDNTRDVFNMTDIAKENIEEARADAVEQSSYGENYYIFLNKNYKPLSKSGWNKIIRKIYTSVGIEIDKGVKRNNLSHRLRHGFAMVCIQNNVDRYTLKELLRHKYISTVEIYFNPTIEDNVKTAVEVSRIIQNKIGINIKRQIMNMK